MSDRNLVYNSTSKDLPKDVFPKGRLRFSYRTRSRAKAHLYKEETIDPLRNQGEWDILRAVQQEVFGIDEVHAELHGNGRWSEGLEVLRERIRTEGPNAAPTYKEAVEMYLQVYSSRRTPGTRASHRATLPPFGRQQVHEKGCPNLNGNGDGEEEEECSCPTVNEHRINEISEFEIQQVLEGLDVASGTRETYRRKLSGFYSWHIQREAAQAKTKGASRHLSYNPAAEAERYRTGGEVTTLDEHQLAAVLAAARPWERAPFLIAAQLGLRAKEVVHLRKGTDLDLERLVVKIQPRGPDPDHACPDCQGDGWWPKRPRDHERKDRDEINSIRTLHIPEDKVGLIRALREHTQLWPVEEGQYFFQNPSPNSNGPWTYESLRYRFKKACEGTEGLVPYGQKTRGGVTLHSLRHTCATEMIRGGVALSVAAAVLGHSVQMLTSTYSHLLAADTATGLRAVPDYDLVTPAGERVDEADE